MNRTVIGLAKRMVWSVLAMFHRIGMSAAFAYVANRFRSKASFPFVRGRSQRNVQILVYHRVRQSPDSFLPSTPLASFEKQMECLARRFRVLNLVEAVEALARGDVPDNAVVITFDDGYRDNFDLAYPILTALSLDATIFLTTGVIGTHRLLWHDRVFRAFNETGESTLREFIPRTEVAGLENPAQKQSSLDRVLGYLKSLGPDQRDRRIDELEDRLGVEGSDPPTRLMLSWEEVRQMQRDGVSFGAHTVTHPTLTRVPLDRAAWEIVESKRQLEQRLQTEVKAFAYPNGRRGDFDASTKQILREAGFTCAVTTMFGANPANGNGRPWDRWELHRGGPDESDPGLFAAKMNVYKFLA